MRNLALVAVLIGVPAAAQTPPPRQTVDFDLEAPGAAPKGFSCARTGEGRPGVWRILRDGSAPSAPQALAQLDADTTNSRFPLCVLDGIAGTDVDLSVRVKPVSGRVDQAGGLVGATAIPGITTSSA